MSKGWGLLDPVNLKPNARKNMIEMKVLEDIGRGRSHFMMSVLLVLAQLYMGGVADENVYEN